MEIKSFSFSLKKINLSFLAICVASGCANLRTRADLQSATKMSGSKTINEETAKAPNSSVETAALQGSETQLSPPLNSERIAPKIGLILGPGAWRAMAHIGVLQEFTKAHLPIVSVVGIEMGSLVGAIYSQRGTPFDVEWQMSKLKEPDSMDSFIQNVFAANKVENFKISFACPAYNMEKAQAYMMNKGPVTQMLPYCLPAPPLMHSHNKNVAGLLEISSSVDYLKSKGANFIIFVRVLGSNNGRLLDSFESDKNILWNMVDSLTLKQNRGVDLVLSVPLQEFDLDAWSKRREITQKGVEAGRDGAVQISKRLGL